MVPKDNPTFKSLSHIHMRILILHLHKQLSSIYQQRGLQGQDIGISLKMKVESLKSTQKNKV